jgi:hypothetical protein
VFTPLGHLTKFRRKFTKRGLDLGGESLSQYFPMFSFGRPPVSGRAPFQSKD